MLEGRYGGEHEAVFEERAVCAVPAGEVAEEGFEVDVFVEYALQVLQALQVADLLADLSTLCPS